MNIDDLCKNALSTFDPKKPLNVSLTYQDGTVYNFCNLRKLTSDCYQFYNISGHRKILTYRGNNFNVRSADGNIDPIISSAGDFVVGFWQPAG